jgi:hypothetical protein
MGPFRRTKSSLRAAETVSSDRRSDIDVESFEYRRLGETFATAVVTVEDAPPAGAFLRIATGDTIHDEQPMLVTHEVPTTDEASHRIWFVTDLSQVMFGDSLFALVVGDAETPLPEPSPCAAWEDDSPAITSAWSQSELTCALHAVEERCRSAERLAAKSGDEDAAQREVEVLQELLATRESAYSAVKDVVDATAADRDARQVEIDELRAAEQRMSKLVSATLADVQSEREELLKQLQDAEREKQELEAELSAQGDMLALMKAELRAHRERFGERDSAIATPVE